VPNKPVFSRAFGVFCFLEECSRCPAPKRRALPTAPHPDLFNLKFLQQLSVALPVAVTASRIAKKFARVLRRLPLLIPRSITHRVRSETSPTAPHPEINAKCKIVIHFFSKWSNLWSNRFYRRFCERA